MSVWFITGASRGFGKELTEAALAQGDQVVAAARDPYAVEKALPEAGDRLLAVALDVTDPEQAATAVHAAVERFGRIDVLVNNAGYGLFGSVEETSDTQVRALFDTNVFGMLNVTRAALPTLRRQRAGHVVNISSSAGFVAGPGRGLYGASKFAVEAITEALRGELAPLGVHATVVEPGSFRTGFLSPVSKQQAPVRIPDYDETVGALHTAIDGNDGRQPGNPAKAAAVILELAAADRPPLRLQLGSDCVGLVEGKLASVAEELDLWRALAVSTDFQKD
ncbi:oxidoreductase [Streptomyces aurantiacus]|uniref:Short-chain dehydrogenase/reductase n=1 Tax=Streptomyces aurantiacus TaxID=47760 RepID=A0A7G1PAU1_9ACTN|nr:oxidoreductase [Streptomyces aurantiacus]BCL32172.1 short-chain dehydrogenase/reductase [Streptomyces aurantiacus]